MRHVGIGFSRATTSLLLSLTVGLAACGGGKAIVGGPFPGDPAELAYELEGTSIKLTKGMHEVRTGAGVDDVVATDLTGARLDADFDGDGATDCAVVLTRDEGPVKGHYLAVIVNPGGELRVLTAKLGQNVLVEGLGPGQPDGVVVALLGRDDGVPVEQAPTVARKVRFVVKEGKLAAAK